MTMIRIGQGFDVHAFAEDRKLILGGIEIPHTKGLLGHSDADVLLHTIADAALGAIAAGDIGFKELIQSIRGHIGIISFLSGIFVAIVAAHGVGLMKEAPLVTTALLAGTILAVGLFRGVPVGPLIGAGIAALVIGMWDVIAKAFTG